MRSLIVIAVIIGIASVVVTIAVGVRTFDGTVSSDPYTEGLQWDATRKARLEAGWKATMVDRELPQGRSELKVRLHDSKGRPLQGAAVNFVLRRRETDRHDRFYHATNGPAGDFSAIVDLPIPGKWLIRTTVTTSARTIYFDGTLQVVDDER